MNSGHAVLGAVSVSRRGSSGGEPDGDAREKSPVSRVSEGTCLGLACPFVETPVVVDEGKGAASSVNGGLRRDGGPEEERRGFAGRTGGGCERECAFFVGVDTDGPASAFSTSQARGGYVSCDALGVALGLGPSPSDKSGIDCLLRCRRIGDSPRLEAYC
jgi:hypothetical protein